MCHTLVFFPYIGQMLPLGEHSVWPPPVISIPDQVKSVQLEEPQRI